MDIQNKTKLTPSEVMQQWKIGRTKLYDLMNNGKLAYEKTEAGKRRIELSEAIRALGEPDSDKASEVPVQSVLLVQALQQQIETQTQIHEKFTAALQDRIEAQQKQLDAMTDSIDRFTRLLEHQKPAEAPQPVEVVEPVAEATPAPEIEIQQPAKRKRSFFQRVLSAAIED